MNDRSGHDTGAPGDCAALRAWVADHRTDMLDDLRRYVDTDTPSDDKGCLDAMLARLERWLTASLGEPAARRRVDGGEHGDVLVLDWPGSGGAAAGDGPEVPPVLLLCHYDTVWEKGTVAARPFAIEGDRASGPGIFDMKAGLVQAVWALRGLAALGLPRPPLRLVLNGDEETGSPASRPVIEAAARGVSAALVFEASADAAVKTARKGVGLFRVTATGVEAHAGLDPAKGVSAVDEIARVVLSLHALADPATGTSVNVGVLAGGTRRNVTAGRAVADIDVRVANQAEADRVDEALAALHPHHPGASLEVTGEWNRPVMERTPGIARLYGLARDLAAEQGWELRECAVGGASDGNFVATLGVPVLDGLGAVGEGAHARHEYVSVAGMVERAALAGWLCRALALPDTVASLRAA
ncbi:M20 family metallopeptidase [Streptomyces sp. TS71-3]|uniref:M20 family metallopeptidase n=1 Tax=Streptomyces sp. TS71-3 TaxID=2733862 RepID=UPI001B12ABBB|nr:M20 family metallopeptidase [Streptomyces sp. TS71-3]GHJ36819.1 peptidase M20 [Streptomyces sp. TS71-3]